MAYIITEACIGTKDATCVTSCPVDCIHPRKDEAAYATTDMLYIDPEACIHCGACEPLCPVKAIFAVHAVPSQWNQYIQINADYYKKQ